MQVPVKTQEENSKVPMWKIKTNLDHSMKQKRNLKDEIDLENNFQNTSQQWTHFPGPICSKADCGNRGLSFNPSSLFFSKAFFRIILSIILFRASNRRDEKNEDEFAFKSFHSWIRIWH